VKRLLLLCGAIAGPLFIIAFLLEGATRAGYNPMRHPVSSLAIGDEGWTQTINFLVTGVLTVLYAVGLRSALKPGKGSVFGPFFVLLWGIGLLGAGLWVTDPVSGYPPGTPGIPDLRTASGILHDSFSAVAFISLPIACFVLTRRFAAERRRGWALYSLLSGILFIVTFVVTSAGFAQTAGLVQVGGLLQRITVGIGFAWLTALALHLRGRDKEE
jgi:hypothetical membrane protein